MGGAFVRRGGVKRVYMYILTLYIYSRYVLIIFIDSSCKLVYSLFIVIFNF